MQTFLPYPSFTRTAQVLHPRHLGNQFYREGLTILRGGWKNHPASKMWAGHHGALCRYLIALHEELRSRGKSYPKVLEEVYLTWDKLVNNTAECGNPTWLGNESFHSSHRSNLLRKDKEKGWNWYTRFGWTEPDNLAYIWPKP